MPKSFSIRAFARALPLLAIGVVSAQTPVVDCVVQNAQTGDLVAYFGYMSNVTPVTIPPGNSNAQFGGLLIGTIPTTFASAAEHILFGVRFHSPTAVSWTLNTKTATADSSMVASPACQLPVGKPITQFLAQQRCWDLGATNKCDPADDVDGDGYCTILDCTGPRGAQGSTGTAGGQGIQGPTGPAGAVPMFQTISSTPGTANATASCSTTQFLVTGGGSCNVPNQPGLGRAANSAASTGGNGWSVSCNAGQATAVAVCANKL
jgi:hypothetical protein